MTQKPYHLQNLDFLDNMFDNMDMSGPSVVTNQQNSISNTFGNDGSLNMQSNNQRTTTASGGGPNFSINGQQADSGDVKNALRALLGGNQALELQNLGLQDIINQYQAY